MLNVNINVSPLSNIQLLSPLVQIRGYTKRMGCLEISLFIKEACIYFLNWNNIKMNQNTYKMPKMIHGNIYWDICKGVQSPTFSSLYHQHVTQWKFIASGRRYSSPGWADDSYAKRLPRSGFDSGPNRFLWVRPPTCSLKQSNRCKSHLITSVRLKTAVASKCKNDLPLPRNLCFWYCLHVILSVNMIARKVFNELWSNFIGI